MNRITYTLLIICIIISSCKKESSDEIKFNENIFFHSELGWKMEIPDGWRNISSDEYDERRKKLDKQFANVPTNLNPIENFGFNLRKNKYNAFHSVYFSNNDNTYNRLTFQQEKLEKFNILKEHRSYSKIDSTETSPFKIGKKIFDGYSITIYFEEGDPIKMTSFTSKIKNFQLLITMNNDDIISENEMLESFYKSQFN